MAPTQVVGNASARDRVTAAQAVIDDGQRRHRAFAPGPIEPKAKADAFPLGEVAAAREVWAMCGHGRAFTFQ